MKKTCKISSCDRKHMAKGYCDSHYHKYCYGNKRKANPYEGMYLARYLNKDRINRTEYLYFMRISVKIKGNILKLQHRDSIVEKIIRKYPAM